MKLKTPNKMCMLSQDKTRSFVFSGADIVVMSTKQWSLSVWVINNISLRKKLSIQRNTKDTLLYTHKNDWLSDHLVVPAWKQNGLDRTPTWAQHSAGEEYQCGAYFTVGTNLSHFHLLAHITLRWFIAWGFGVNPAVHYTLCDCIISC